MGQSIRVGAGRVGRHVTLLVWYLLIIRHERRAKASAATQISPGEDPKQPNLAYFFLFLFNLSSRFLSLFPGPLVSLT